MRGYLLGIVVLGLLGVTSLAAAETAEVVLSRVMNANLVYVQRMGQPGQPELLVTLDGVCAVRGIDGHASRNDYRVFAGVQEGLAVFLAGTPYRLEYTPGAIQANVTGILWDGDQNVNEQIAGWLRDKGYPCAP